MFNMEIIGVFIDFAFVGLSVYYFCVTRNRLSKLFIISIIFLLIRDILGNFVSPDAVAIINYSYLITDIILHLFLMVLFYLLYKLSVSGLQRSA